MAPWTSQIFFTMTAGKAKDTEKKENLEAFGVLGSDGDAYTSEAELCHVMICDSKANRMRNHQRHRS